MSKFKGKVGGLSSSDELGDSQGLEAFLNAKDISEENKFISKGAHKMTAMQNPYDEYYDNMNQYDDYGFEDEEEEEIDEYNFEVDFSKPKAATKNDSQFSVYQQKKKEREAKLELKKREEELLKAKEAEARLRLEAKEKAENEAFLASIEENARRQKERVLANRVSDESNYYDPSNEENLTKSHFEESEYFGKKSQDQPSDYNQSDFRDFGREKDQSEFYDAEYTSKLMNEMASASLKEESEIAKPSSNQPQKKEIAKTIQIEKGKVEKVDKPEMKNNNYVAQPQNQISGNQNPNFIPIQNLQNLQNLQNFQNLQNLLNFQNQTFPQNLPYPELIQFNNSLAARQEIFNKLQNTKFDPHDTFVLRSEIDNLKAFIAEQDAQFAQSLRNLSIAKGEIEQVTRMLEVSELRIKSKDSEILTLKSELRKKTIEGASISEKFVELEMLKQENTTLRNELKQVYLLENAPDKLGVKIKAEYEGKVRALQDEILSLRSQIKETSSLRPQKNLEIEKELKAQEFLLLGFQQENEKLIAANQEARKLEKLPKKEVTSITELSNAEELTYNRKAVAELQAENASLKWEMASLQKEMQDLKLKAISPQELTKRELLVSDLENQLLAIKDALSQKEAILDSKEKANKVREENLLLKIQELSFVNEKLVREKSIPKSFHSPPEIAPSEDSSTISLLKSKLTESQKATEKLLTKAEELSVALSHEQNERRALEKVLAGLKTSGEPGIRMAVLDKKLQYVEQTMEMKNLHFRELLRTLALEDTLVLKEENTVLREKLRMAAEEGKKCKEELAQILFDVKKLK